MRRYKPRWRVALTLLGLPLLALYSVWVQGWPDTWEELKQARGALRYVLTGRHGR